jgi:hypothetical protein
MNKHFVFIGIVMAVLIGPDVPTYASIANVTRAATDRMRSFLLN